MRVRRKDVEALEQLHERLVIGERAGPATVIEIGNERRPTNRQEVDVVGTDRDRLGGITAPSPTIDGRETRPRRRPRPGYEPSRRRRRARPTPRQPENLPGLRQQHPHAVLLEQTYRLAVEVVDLVVAQHPIGRERKAQTAWCAVERAAPVAAAAAASHLNRRSARSRTAHRHASRRRPARPRRWRSRVVRRPLRIGGELEFVEEGPKPAVGAPCGELRPLRVERIGIVDDDQVGRPALFVTTGVDRHIAVDHRDAFGQLREGAGPMHDHVAVKGDGVARPGKSAPVRSGGGVSPCAESARPRAWCRGSTRSDHRRRGPDR